MIVDENGSAGGDDPPDIVEIEAARADSSGRRNTIFVG
jgi:hypothetical protein